MMIDDMAATAFFARSGGTLVVAAAVVLVVSLSIGVARADFGKDRAMCADRQMGHAALVSCFFRSLLTLPRTVLSLLQFGSLIRM